MQEAGAVRLRHVGATRRCCCLKEDKCCWERNASNLVPLDLILDRAHKYQALNESSDHQTRVGAVYCCLKKDKCHCWERNTSNLVPLDLILDRAQKHWGLNESSNQTTLDVMDGVSMVGQEYRPGFRVELAICNFPQSECHEGQDLKHRDLNTSLDIAGKNERI